MITTLLTHIVQIVPADISNPFDNVVPDFTIFGVQFTSLWQKALAGIWGIAIVIAAVYLILGATAMATASGPGANPMAHAEGRKKFVNAIIALAVLAAIALIVGAIFTFVG